MGDHIQAIKAGIFEVGIVFVINKSDRPDAQKTMNELKAMLEIAKKAARRKNWEPSILMAEALSNKGITELQKKAALASAELAGGCSGIDFLTAVAVGTELGIRLNLGESQCAGFDPTGVCVPFAATAAGARILRLSEKETWNALALAFNKCGGSFQANVDGSLAVRVIQGWVSQTGVTCFRSRHQS